jgi:hypothetical protein
LSSLSKKYLNENEELKKQTEKLETDLRISSEENIKINTEKDELNKLSEELKQKINEKDLMISEIEKKY